eukprot:CFRG1362T1
MPSSEDDDISGKDDDVTLPRATVYKIIKELMPSDMRITNETRELLIECCTEFIHLIATESNDVCAKTGKKTIGPDHVIEGLKNLGFEHYLTNVHMVLEDHKEEKTIRNKKKAKGKNQGVSPEELLAQQRALFAKARARSDSQMGSLSTGGGVDSTTSVHSESSQSIPTSAPAVSASGAGFAPSTTHLPTPSLLKKEYDEEEDYD